MLLQKIYQNRSKRLTWLLSKSTNDLTEEERKELFELLYKEDKNKKDGITTVHR